MKNDFKLMLLALVFSFLLIIGLSSIFGKKGQDPSEIGIESDVEAVEATPESYDLGEVPINGGIVTREYKLKNISERTLKLKKIATSCMCTQAKVSINGKETRFFGMEHSMDKNPPVNMEINPGEVANVIVTFDPAAHGPQGLGAFERMVWLTFSDPVGVKELKFSGSVVN